MSLSAWALSLWLRAFPPKPVSRAPAVPPTASAPILVAAKDYPMAFSFAQLFTDITVALADAEYIETRLQFYITTVDSSTLTGAQKLDAVKAALEADLKTYNPDLAAKFDALWTVLAPAVSGLVTIWRLTGELAGIAKAASAVAAAV